MCNGQLWAPTFVEEGLCQASASTRSYSQNEIMYRSGVSESAIELSLHECVFELICGIFHHLTSLKILMHDADLTESLRSIVRTDFEIR
jgi:hypothetical protein